MSHTRKFKSFIVNYNGDYSGNLCFTKAVDGARVILDSEESESLDLYITMAELREFVRSYSATHERQPLKVEIEITGLVHEDGATHRSFSVLGSELLNFYVESVQHEVVGILDSMESSEFYINFMQSVDVSADDICRAARMMSRYPKIRIWGKVDLDKCSELTSLKERDGLWLFVDYAESGVALGTKFNNGACQLVKVIDQFDRVLGEIPQGYKTICKFKFPNDTAPSYINNLQTLIDWRLTKNSVYLRADG